MRQPSPKLAGWAVHEVVGEGVTSIVYRAVREDGAVAALKVARDGFDLTNEIALVERIGRRWGPVLVESGPGYVATSWTDGEPLATRPKSAELALVVAHAVGRGLDELHRAGVRHGDVKPANILVHGRHTARIERASERGATLIDLGLARDVARDHAGFTPHYLAPEVRRGDPATPAADVYALGVVLREIANTDWFDALLAPHPGGRPSAGWVADRARRALGLAIDPAEAVAERRARIRRTRLASKPEGPLGAARWLVALVGPVAAAWPAPSESLETLATRFDELAGRAPPEAWTYDDVFRFASARPHVDEHLPDEGPPLWIALARALALPRPAATVLDRAEAEIERAPMLASDLARALLRQGEVGRAFAVAPKEGELRAEIARRRGDPDAEAIARSAGACAILARLAWDAGDYDRAEKELGHRGVAAGPAVAEVRALIAYARGDHERGLAVLDEVSAVDDDLGRARIEGTRGMLEHARGRAAASLAAFARATELATRAGAVVEEATYLTGLAAAAVDDGAATTAIASATRGALLWERLGRPAMAARAHLSRAAAYALVGATHEADQAAAEVRKHDDARAASFARWAIVETRPPGDERARDEALAAYAELEDEDQLRAAARVLVWAPETKLDLAALDARAGSASMLAGARASAAARWEWWGARRVLSEIVKLLDVPAPIGSRGPALHAGVELARAVSDGALARRFELARRAARAKLEEGAPPEHRAALAAVGWAKTTEVLPSAALGGAQVAELEAIVQALPKLVHLSDALSTRDRLKPLLAQVVDTMVLWTGVERGLLLVRAPNGGLVPRAARNLAREDLSGEQLSLSTGLAQRAIDERQPILATDAFAQIGDLHASVHALGLRSVLAVPLVARGDVVGVVYLDDRVRRGAFGPSELAWVNLVASQAALAIADARDQVLLRRAVRRAERANERLSAELGAREVELANARAELQGTRFTYDDIVGRSEPMRAMLRLVDRVTTSDVPVLVSGESGTGKELVARAIHRNGPRGRRAFVSENCGSVPETLLESTLFGHVRGAFTGASSTRAGLFDVADGGTLFLDEIGEMPPAMQTKLLRVLQDGEVRPVGGERSRKVNVRIIGATHRDLEAMVAAGTFREDLFYRLNVVSIRVPPLRERPEDIPLLAHRFVEKYSSPKKTKVTRAAIDRLAAYPWPGNVRQLENEVRRALVLADDRVDVAELSEEVARGGPNAARDAGVGLRARVDALEAQLVREALSKTNGNQTRAAEALGVSRFGLQKMMRRLKISSV